MKLIVNGAAYELLGAGTITALLEEMGARSEQVAVMVNDEVIPRAGRKAVVLKASDRIEVVSYCGGG